MRAPQSPQSLLPSLLRTGYTLLFTDLSTHAIMPSLYSKLAFTHARDLVAVAPVSSSPLIMVAHPSVGVKNAKELIALAKRSPGITCGNSGIGTVTHLAAEKFRTRAGIDLTAVNYKGGTTFIQKMTTPYGETTFNYSRPAAGARRPT